ncbi:MAG: DHH family phosphoesterase, partial [Pseudomonadota bacterium]|nr:DHH family phosphoesterase [Pseudomonadota bacterium]
MDLDIAVDEIVSAIVDNKKIGIIGDYDVDGTTSASLLTKFFSHYNVETSTYIPNRLKDGYGPNIEAFENFKNDGIDTVITVDCGATALKSMEFAYKSKIKVIIIDHHKVDGKLPKCF